MINRLHKMIVYLNKLFRHPNPLSMISLVKHVKSKHALNALAACLDDRPIAVELRHHLGLQDLQFFKKVLSFRQKRHKKEFFLWKHEERLFCATYVQFIGLLSEYLSGEFHHLYPYDWKNKVVLDIGGFIGDSALFFLEQGARSVIIYEPSPENVYALKFNLGPFQNQITLFEKAIAKQEGLITLTSDKPSGSAGFGLQRGKHQLTCPGTTFTSILTLHPADVIKVDCEGGEELLTDICADLIGLIPYWIIETHSSIIEEKIKNKFEQSGYSLLFFKDCTPGIRVLHFQSQQSKPSVTETSKSIDKLCKV